MSNSYQKTTAHSSVACSQARWDAIDELLNADAERLMSSGEDSHCIDFEYADGHLYAYSEDFCNPDALPEPLLLAIGQVLQEANLPYWEFGVAYYADKARPASCGGFAFRIYPDGVLLYSGNQWARA